MYHRLYSEPFQNPIINMSKQISINVNIGCIEIPIMFIQMNANGLGYE